MTNHARRTRLPAPESVPPLPPLPGGPPPSLEVAQHNISQAIGQSVAFHVAQLLTPVLQRLVDQQEQPGCLPCTARAKAAERAWEIDTANAKAAAEPEPGKPDVRVTQSITQGARGPVCWGCFDPVLDGPVG